jgi:hypothetical protein
MTSYSSAVRPARVDAHFGTSPAPFFDDLATRVPARRVVSDEAATGTPAPSA